MQQCGVQALDRRLRPADQNDRTRAQVVRNKRPSPKEDVHSDRYVAAARRLRRDHGCL